MQQNSRYFHRWYKHWRDKLQMDNWIWICPTIIWNYSSTLWHMGQYPLQNSLNLGLKPVSTILIQVRVMYRWLFSVTSKIQITCRTWPQIYVIRNWKELFWKTAESTWHNTDHMLAVLTLTPSVQNFEKLKTCFPPWSQKILG